MLKGNKRSAGQLAGASGAAGFLLTLRWLPQPRPPPATPTRFCRRQRFPAALAGRGASQEVEKPFLPLPRRLRLHQPWQKPPGAGWGLMHCPQVFLQGHVSFPVGQSCGKVQSVARVGWWPWHGCCVTLCVCLHSAGHACGDSGRDGDDWGGGDPAPVALALPVFATVFTLG